MPGISSTGGTLVRGYTGQRQELQLADELHRHQAVEAEVKEKMSLGDITQQREGEAELSVSETGLVGCSCLMSILHHIIERPITTVLCLSRCVLCFLASPLAPHRPTLVSSVKKGRHRVDRW